ncbi:AMP-binding protein [Thalassobacter stenotrophicus]|nr:AMP-binding protein [Thalassobacter stenotrophicus]
MADASRANPRTIQTLQSWDAMREAFVWNVPDIFNIAEACCDRWAALAPDQIALIEHTPQGRVEWSYRALKDASDRLAGALRARGFERGDRLGILLPQCAATLIAHFATHKLGGISLPLFTLFGPDALAYRLRDSGAAALITHPAELEKLAGLDLPALHTIITTEPAPGALSLEDALEHAPLPSPVQTSAEDPAVMIYTSGTTGAPKGVLHAHRFLIGHMPSVECHHEGFPQAGDKGWTPADWAWIGGLMDMALPCLYHGVPLVALRMAKFDAERAWALIADEGIRNLFLPPTALKLMRAAPRPTDLNIRTIGSGGEALGPDLLEWSKRELGVAINEFYGQTECNLVLASCAGTMPQKPGSMGRAVPGFDVSIRGPEGALPNGTVGEICIRTPNPCQFLNYWNLPEKTAQKVRDGWLYTGDLGVMDDDGYVTFAARDDDVITSSGYRIGPSEIETCLSAHPDVTMAAVVGLPDPARTEAVTAFITCPTDARDIEATLIAHVKSRLSPHLAPRRVIILDALPMTATGKIQRRVLRDHYATLYTD